MPPSSSSLRGTPRCAVPRRLVLAIVALLLAFAPAAARAQLDHGMRMGLTVGGTSFAGISLEFFKDGRSVEVTVGTWAARDLALSVVGRQYFGAAAARPVVGLGLWMVWAFPPEGQQGLALVARAPIGVDWNVAGDHFLALDLNVNRGLLVRRSDPEDQAPMNRRLVPLPGVAYRWKL